MQKYIFPVLLISVFGIQAVCALRAEKSIADGIWLSQEEIAQLPTAGAAWERLKEVAEEDFGKAQGGHNDNHDVYTMAQALVAARLNSDNLRARVAANIMSAIGTEKNGNALSIARNLLSYVVAADVIGLKNFDSEKDAAFCTWLAEVRVKKLDKHGSLIDIQERRPNNFGTHATATRAAIAIYLGERDELERTSLIFRGWMGDQTAYKKFKFGELSWQANLGQPVGINPKGAMKNGHSIDGVLPDDQRRGGRFSWPPPKENYVYGALQGALAAAHILNRAGFDTWNWQDQALLRAYVWLHNEADFPPTGDDTWQLPLVDYAYGTNFWNGEPTQHGKNMGWTDWTHAQRKGNGTSSSTN